MTRFFGAAVCVALLMVCVLALRASPDVPILEIILVKSQREADAILEKVRAGEPFELLASRHSIDPTAADGGYLGQIKTEYLRTELREALKSVGADGISNVFPASGGYMIWKILTTPRETAQAHPPASHLL